MAMVTRIEAARFERKLLAARNLLQGVYHELEDLRAAIPDPRISNVSLADHMEGLSRIVERECSGIERAWAAVVPYASTAETSVVEHVVTRIRRDAEAMRAAADALRACG